MTAFLVIHAILWGMAAIFFALVACWGLDTLPPDKPSAARYAFHLGSVVLCAVMTVVSIALI